MWLAMRLEFKPFKKVVPVKLDPYRRCHYHYILLHWLPVHLLGLVKIKTQTSGVHALPASKSDDQPLHLNINQLTLCNFMSDLTSINSINLLPPVNDSCSLKRQRKPNAHFICCCILGSILLLLKQENVSFPRMLKCKALGDSAFSHLRTPL